MPRPRTPLAPNATCPGCGRRFVSYAGHGPFCSVGCELEAIAAAEEAEPHPAAIEDVLRVRPVRIRRVYKETP